MEAWKFLGNYQHSKVKTRNALECFLIQWNFLSLHSLKVKVTEMAKKGKGNRVQVILECTEHKESGMPGTSRYVTTKNRKNTPDRMEIKKFNPILRKMTVHKEIK